VTEPAPKRRARRVDPRTVLAEIAGDPTISAALRLRAASKLLAAEQRDAARARTTNGVGELPDKITARALQLAAERRSTQN
jgi:hypothetical protein